VFGMSRLGWATGSAKLRPRFHFAMFLAHDLETTQSPVRTDGRGNLSMTGFYGWAALAALGFLTVMALVSRPEQIWSNLYVLAICWAAGALFTAVKRFEPNRWLALLLMILIFGIGAAAVARQLGASR